ncbi:Transposase, IS4 [Richelia intracellularis]|nr:Transposase, IS4 [Richelia intracellularis]
MVSLTRRLAPIYLTSLNCDAPNLGQVIRLHWGVENGLHWTLGRCISAG